MTATATPDQEVSPSFGWITAMGWVVLGLITFIWFRVTLGAVAIRTLIGDYEAAHGSIPIERGMVMEDGQFVWTPAMSELDQALVDRADYFYPFGVAVLIVLAE